MSRVYVLAVGRELPHLKPLSYYRQAVEELGYPMKPFRYELSLESKEKDVKHVRACLEENFFQGEVIELWSVWLSGDVDKKCPPRFQGRLADFDRETLEQFLSAEEICLTITI